MKPLPHGSRQFWKSHSSSPFLAPSRMAAALAATLFATSVLLVSATAADPVISEFMASNGDTIVLADSSSPDWIEIHNPGATPIDLEGWHLTDTASDLNAWTFPAGASIAAGEYLLVYASGLDIVGPGGEYHTSFKLGDAGEYLALVRPDGTVLQEFSPTYPKQYGDISYGIPPGGTPYGYFQTPTPGAANGGAVLGFVKDTTFSHKRGFYDATFQLDVTTATPGATIYYTTDGSNPSPSGASVAAPDAATPPLLSLPITTTTIVRAYAAKTGFESTNVDTQTYLFLDDVIADPEMSTTITQHATWGPQMRDALLEIPSISLVTQGDIPDKKKPEDLLPGEDAYKHAPEVHVSIEMIFPDGSDGFQANAAVERFGGQFTVFPKQALRVSFKSEIVNTVYDQGSGQHIEVREPIDGPKRLKFDLFGDAEYGGETAVDSFDQVILRNGSHDSVFSHHYSHSRGAYMRSRYCFDRQIEAGHLSMRGKFVHVYHNGTYNGQYHLMERPNADFMATHLGGEEEDYDIMKGRSGIFVSQGESTAWDHLIANTNNWTIVQDYMDVDNYIDYMLLNFYGGNDHDWYPGHNWVAGRKREEGAKFQFFMWDNDFLIRRGGNSSTGSTANTVNNGGPGNMLSDLDNHAEFRIRMADRAQKHFFNGGMLTPARVKADFTELGGSISRTIIPEAARWAEQARDDFTNVDYTPASFQNYVDWIVDVNADTRSDVVIGQMRDAGLFPDLAAPVFNQHGGKVSPGFALLITNDIGKIYYTVDGSDPRLPGGDINPDAVEFPGSIVDFTAVAAGSDWKYSDGGDLGTAWRAVEFDDSAWASGTAPLGFGTITSTPTVTPVNSDRHLTFYCRKSFEISAAASIINTALQIHADDGAVVYINGTEVARDGMPDGVISFSTQAAGGGNEGEFDTYPFDHNVLVEGTNTIAVEVHNERLGSGDMVIDLALVGTRLNEATPISIDATTTVRTRSLEAGEWSALNETTFLAGVAATPSNLVISEIHYHPSVVQGELSEYIEVMNISAQTVDLAGVAFTNGIDFAFADSDTLAPGARAVLVADPAAFASAYGAGATVFGTYTSRLSDGGERVTLSTADGSPLQSLRYNDRAPWPREPDGGGYSLVLISPESAPDHELAQNWRASVDPGGSAGTGDAIPFVGDPASDLLAYALGDPNAVGVTTIDGVPVFAFPRVLGADDVTVSVEISNDLVNWRAGEAVLLDQSDRTGGSILMRWAFATDAGDQHYARLAVTLTE